MCDSMVSTPLSSAGKVMILGKNSDREPNEAQNITFIPAMDHPPGSTVQCTYISIPQVKHTCAALLSRPFWMYGAEMGVNEHGVAIGNEAVFTREKYHTRNDALLGMDMLRLALERSQDAREAIDVVVQMLETYGQGGVHTMEGIRYYHNSFIIADPAEAYIVETAGTHWAYKKVRDIASISNCLTIEDDYTNASREVELKKVKKKAGRGQVNFSRDFSDAIFTHFARGRIRRSCSYRMLEQRKGSIDITDMMNILRHHSVVEPYRPGQRPMRGICLHAGGLISSQTAGSMVAVLRKELPPLVYYTGTSAPCMSIFKPHVIVKNQMEWSAGSRSQISPFGGIDIYGTATDKYDDSTLWWTGETIHRRIVMDYAGLMPVLQSNRDPVESSVIRAVEKKWKTSKDKDLQKMCEDFTEGLIEAQIRIAEIIKKEFAKLKGKKEVPWWFAAQWRKINTKAGFML